MMTMTFHATREADGTIHVQNAVGGALGQHHVHTEEDFERWKQPSDDIHWMMATSPCRCGLKAGQKRNGR